jgi:hypothetical protein
MGPDLARGRLSGGSEGAAARTGRFICVFSALYGNSAETINIPTQWYNGTFVRMADRALVILIGIHR